MNGDSDDNTAVDSGAVYLFERSGEVWRQQVYLKASNSEAEDFFGTSVAMSRIGDRLVIGATGEDSAATGVNGDQGDNGATRSGAAYMFVRDAGKWVQEAYIKPSNPDPNDFFGAFALLPAPVALHGFELSEMSGKSSGRQHSRHRACKAAHPWLILPRSHSRT
ncbi:MAG: FG-GAP repeat protein [Myxococcota bacterium]